MTITITRLSSTYANPASDASLAKASQGQ
jgi:hypothetical protein